MGRGISPPTIIFLFVYAMVSVPWNHFFIVSKVLKLFEKRKESRKCDKNLQKENLLAKA